MSRNGDGGRKGGNWIKVSRNLLDQPFWNEKPFSKGQAWIDLMLTVHWKTGYDPVGKRKRKALPGQRWITYQALAERWGWPKIDVYRFLHKLAETERVTLYATAYGTLLTLKNWDFYQHGETLDETLPETQGEIPTIYIKKKEERSDPLRGDGDQIEPDPDEDDEGMTEEEWNEFIRIQSGGS